MAMGKRGKQRRMRLRGHGNIIKRALIDVAAFIFRVLMRKALGAGSPRATAALSASLFAMISVLKTYLKRVTLKLAVQSARLFQPAHPTLRAA
jgi:hypothetical protein